MAASDQRAHWNSVSGHWAFLGPPLKPSAGDIEVMLDMVSKHRLERSSAPYRVLLWGVTPELATMAWPSGTQLLAIDHSARMIDSVWPGNVPGLREAVRGEWSESLRLSGGGVDLVIGDGSLSCVSFPEDYSNLADVAVESLCGGGLLVLRLHAGPDVREQPEQVVEDLQELRIGNFHIFKFRLAMALQETPEVGVEIGQVWEYWRALAIDEAVLAERTGWDPQVIRTIHLYRGKRDRYSFPTVQQHLGVLKSRLELVDVRTPEYEMGERRPIVALAKHSG